MITNPMPLTLPLIAFVLSAAPALAVHDETRYRGMCDASAAVALAPRHFVVADDDHDVLSIYELGKPEPTANVDLIDYLGNRNHDGKPKEADIEGSARIGNRIYWISSHGRNSKGRFQETRQRFFATDVVENASGPTVRAPTTPPYKRLLRDIVEDPRFEPIASASALAIPPEAPGGLNIEGLAATPEGHLLIGFRNPLSGGKALLVPLKNPADVIDRAATPVFGDLIALDLGLRGIRSIDFVDSGFLIVAGPFDNGKRSGKGFALYTWTGKLTDSPKRVKGIDFGDFRPEALFSINGNTENYVLSDDGDENVDGLPCKDKGVPAHKKSFRGAVLRLPDLDSGW